MHETTADVRRDIAETRARVSQTLAELDTEVSSRKEAVVARVADAKARVTGTASQAQTAVADFVQEHPWVALATALAIGVLVSGTGADVKAAQGAVSASKAAGRGAADAARSGVDAAKGLLHRSGDSQTVASAGGAHSFTHDPQTGAIGSSSEDVSQEEDTGIMYRLTSGLVEAVGGSDLIEEMRREARKFAAS